MLQKVENYRHALDQLEKSIISYSFIELNFSKAFMAKQTAVYKKISVRKSANRYFPGATGRT